MAAAFVVISPQVQTPVTIFRVVPYDKTGGQPMPFDATPPEQPPPRPWPPRGLWCNQDCTICKGKTATGKGEACDDCCRYEDGSPQ